MKRGTIKSWNPDRAFGFIIPDDGGDDVFVHAKLVGQIYMHFRVGLRVRFEEEMGARGRRATVVKIWDGDNDGGVAKDE